mmetsp:Transcript_31101/g.49797  ORF Transcript_31101/g.49797 Transcript_31101/m.49797 type:complete len:324 (+) Transcript_31101:1135-2106(+)
MEESWSQLVASQQVNWRLLGCILGWLGWVFSQLSTCYADFSRSLGAGQRLKQFSSRMHKTESDRKLELFGSNSQLEMECKHVSFRYQENDTLVLSDLNIKLVPGEMVALAGASGAGKSTLVSLLTRINNGYDGRITINGTEIGDFPLGPYRQLVSVVDQKPGFFSSMSIADNIRYGKLDATMEEVQSAARQADLDSFICSLPAGYDTILGNQGDKFFALSVGQTQRLALARAFLRKSKIYILDEATSSLDGKSEQQIQSCVRTLARSNCIVFIIAHRLTTLQTADKILLLKDGNIAEQGTYNELISLQGQFCQLTKQLKEEGN